MPMGSFPHPLGSVSGVGAGSFAAARSLLERTSWRIGPLVRRTERASKGIWHRSQQEWNLRTWGYTIHQAIWHTRQLCPSESQPDGARFDQRVVGVPGRCALEGDRKTGAQLVGRPALFWPVQDAGPSQGVVRSMMKLGPRPSSPTNGTTADDGNPGQFRLGR